jgi:hypothetical protein
MKQAKQILFTIIGVVILGAIAYGTIAYYPYVFAKSIKGVIQEVKRVTDSSMVIGGGSRGIPENLAYSFAVAIKDEEGRIHTSSSEDRKWAVAQAGMCVEARFLAYPFWDLSRRGTYFGAQLIELKDCQSAQKLSTEPNTNP